MKKLLLVLSALMSIVVLMAFNTGDGGHETMDSSGGPAGYAGDPSGGNKTCGSGGGCHTGATVGTMTGVITSDIPTAGYTAGATYTVTANFVRPGHTKFGFQISPQKSTGTLLGTMAILNAQTKLVGTSKYITHTSSGTSGTGSKTWSFKWTAPATGQGPVTFYGTFNATNSNNNDTGDSIFKSTLVVTENPTAVNNYQENNFSLSTFPNPTHDDLNVTFSLPEPSLVEICLFDIHGNKVGNLFSEKELNGGINKTFDLSKYPQGIYFLNLMIGENSSLQKIIKL